MDKPKYKCVSQKDFRATVMSYRDVSLFRVTTKTGDTWKFTQYTATNHRKKIAFNTLDQCADYIDAHLNDTNAEIAGRPIIWVVRQSSLAWFTK